MYTVNLIFNWSLVIGAVGLFGYSCAWVAATWTRGHISPEPCGRKHRDEL